MISPDDDKTAMFNDYVVNVLDKTHPRTDALGATAGERACDLTPSGNREFLKDPSKTVSFIIHV